MHNSQFYHHHHHHCNASSSWNFTSLSHSSLQLHRCAKCLWGIIAWWTRILITNFIFYEHEKWAYSAFPLCSTSKNKRLSTSNTRARTRRVDGGIVVCATLTEQTRGKRMAKWIAKQHHSRAKWRMLAPTTTFYPLFSLLWSVCDDCVYHILHLEKHHWVWEKRESIKKVLIW